MGGIGRAITRVGQSVGIIEKPKRPPPPPPARPAPVAEGPTKAEVEQATAVYQEGLETKRRGRASTIMSGRPGITNQLDEASTTRKTLLGG